MSGSSLENPDCHSESKQISPQKCESTWCPVQWLQGEGGDGERRPACSGAQVCGDLGQVGENGGTLPGRQQECAGSEWCADGVRRSAGALWDFSGHGYDGVHKFPNTWLPPSPIGCLLWEMVWQCDCEMCLNLKPGPATSLPTLPIEWGHDGDGS